MSVTIKDIAQHLDVNISTVSRALKNHPDIHPNTKKAVLLAAKELNYQPNSIASSLRSRKSNTIGIIIPSISNHFYSLAIDGIEDLAYQAGYKVIIAQSNESYKREQLNINAMLSSRIDGLIIAASLETNNYEHLEELIAQKTPVVLFNRVLESAKISKVISDDFDGAHKATSHLIKIGCKKILYLGGPEQLVLTTNRQGGYMKALSDHQIGYDKNYTWYCGKEIKDGLDAMNRILEEKIEFDGIMSFNDRVAIGAILAMKKVGIKIPDDVSIIGFSNTPGSFIIDPPLTTVEQSAFEMGTAAFKLLQDQMANSELIADMSNVKFETKLILRESTK